MIVHFAYLPLPSLALHLITARPFFLPTTVPLVVTVAIFLFEETQVTALLFAVAGPTVALSVIFPFLFMVAVFLFNLIEETIITELIVHLAVILLPSFDLHVITAEPFPTALTTPVDETVATLVFDDDHVTALLFAAAGPTVALSVNVAPFLIVLFVALSLMDVTGCETVTVHFASLPLPSLALHVITAVPFDTAVIVPLFTVATLLLEVVHSTFLLFALAGATVDVIRPVYPQTDSVLSD